MELEKIVQKAKDQHAKKVHSSNWESLIFALTRGTIKEDSVSNILFHVDEAYKIVLEELEKELEKGKAVNEYLLTEIIKKNN